MGNSNTTLQQVVDSVAAIGDLNTVFASAGGYAAEPALTIAADVFGEMISERFPWKWNRMKIPAFVTSATQQDYASTNITNIGWLENGFRVQMNSTQVPPPVWPITVVRDLAVSRMPAGWPVRACWFPNDQLEQGVWPGPGVDYVDPISQTTMPPNPWTNILDANGNILVLTKYGTTGLVPPVAPAWVAPVDDPDAVEPDDWPIGAVIDDGTCEWTVANPSAQGIRIEPPPPNSSASIWVMRFFAQKQAPVITDLQQKLDPLPDDYLKWFRDGFIAYAHRYSSNPNVIKRYPVMKAEWLKAMLEAAKQGDREDEGKGFYPARGLLSPEYYSDPGPGNPYWRQWGGS